MTQSYLLDRLKLVQSYFKLLTQKQYKLIDLNMIEPFYVEDKQYHPTNIVFERNYNMQSVRSDWTRSILNYKKLYNLVDNKLGYYGPVIREDQTIYQAGVEMFNVTTDEIMQSILLHTHFIKGQSKVPFRTMIVNDDKLIDLYLEKYQLNLLIKQLIYNKDISSLEENLGKDHPLYQIMTTTVSNQFDLICQEFKEEPLIQTIKTLKEKMNLFHFKFILDLSFRSPQRYYNGFYFQIFLSENSPILSGGQYDKDAFGIAINLSNGGLL